MNEERQLIYRVLLELGKSPQEAERLSAEIDKITRSANRAAAANDKLSKSAKANAKLQEDQARASGLAGAAAFELGRTISDLPFGIVAVTNNISQLGNLFFALVANTKSFTGALKALKTQLVGPAGILIAFQIVTAAITFFSQKQKKAEEDSDKTDESIQRQIRSLRNLRKEFEASGGQADVLEESAVANEKITDSYAAQLLTVEETTEALRIQEEVKQLALDLAKKDKQNQEEIKELEQEKQRILDNQEKTEKIRRNLRRQGFTEDEVNAEMERRRQRDLEGLEKRRNNLRRKGLSEEQIMLETQEQEFDILRSVDDVQADINKKREEANRIEDERFEKIKRLRELEKLGLERAKAQRELDESQFSVARRSLEQELQILEESEVQQLDAKRELVDKLYKLELERLEAQKQEELRGITDPQIINAIELKYANLAKVVGMDFAEQMQRALKQTKLEVEIQPIVSVEDILNKPQTEAQKFAQKQLEDYAEGVMDEFGKFVKSSPRFKKKKEEAEKEFTLEDAFGLTQEALDATFGLLDAQFEREIALEQAKTIAVNDQLRERLRNEQLSADERDRINQEIARNDAALVEKQNEIEKKRFKLNKAAAISNAIVNTALAVSNALKDLPVPANFIAAGVVGAAGAAQIAAIASQQFVPQASPNPTLTGLGTSQPAAPAFNVVGSSQRNQLAEAVSSALSDKPVKAYVVSSDVSTAQELDRRIVEGASI
jgi:hypothetical protein